MEVHVWELLKSKNLHIVVDITKSLKDNIKNIVSNDVKLYASKLDIQPARLYEYFIWQKSAIPLEMLFSLSDMLKLNKDFVESNIIMYKHLGVPEKNSIKDPKLPIKITPYFTSIIANLFFDGSVPEDGKGTYYNQKNKDIMNDFIEKVKEVFGDTFYSLRLDHRHILKCRIPRVIGEICRHIYNVNSFGTFNARIPDLVFNLSKEHKKAFVITGIIDEGSIAYDGSIIFGVSNKGLIEDFNRLCVEIGLETSGIKQRKKLNQYYLYITSKNSFSRIYNKFHKRFNLISLRYKAERLEKHLEIKKQKCFHTREFADKRRGIILKELGIKEYSINELAAKHLIEPRTLRGYMYLFIKQGKVKRKKQSNEFIYYI